MNISYTRKGDYLLPNLILENKEHYNIRKYGLLRLDYIKNNKKSLYIKLLMKCNQQLLWIKNMNNIKNRAEEIILKEYIYV